MGTFSSETEGGVITCTGSFCKNVEVNMKKVNRRTVTSDIAVMSMRVSFFFILTFPILSYLAYNSLYK